MSRLTVTIMVGAFASVVLTGCASDPTPGLLPQESPPATDLILRNWMKGHKGDLRECPLTLHFGNQGNLFASTNTGVVLGHYSTEGTALTIHDMDLRPRPSAPKVCGRQVTTWLGNVAGFSVDGMRLVLSANGQEQQIVMKTKDVAASTLASALVGLSEGFAKRVVTTSDLEFRVAEIDGRGQPLLLDFRSWRINVKVNAGRVTDAYVG